MNQQSKLQTGVPESTKDQAKPRSFGLKSETGGQQAIACGLMCISLAGPCPG